MMKTPTWLTDRNSGHQPGSSIIHVIPTARCSLSHGTTAIVGSSTLPSSLWEIFHRWRNSHSTTILPGKEAKKLIPAQSSVSVAKRTAGVSSGLLRERGWNRWNLSIHSVQMFLSCTITISMGVGDLAEVYVAIFLPLASHQYVLQVHTVHSDNYSFEYPLLNMYGEFGKEWAGRFF